MLLLDPGSSLSDQKDSSGTFNHLEFEREAHVMKFLGKSSDSYIAEVAIFGMENTLPHQRFVGIRCENSCHAPDREHYDDECESDANILAFALVELPA
jgi:hypothetical protein